MVAKRSQSPASQAAAAQQPRPAQPAAEAPTAATTTSAPAEDLFTLNDAGIVVLKAQPYLYLEGRGPFKQVAGELWEKLFTLPNFAPTPQGAWAMWGCGYIDSTKEESDSQRFVYRAGVVRVDGATVDAVEGLSLGTLPGEDCGACRYCKFDMQGPYDALAAAYVDAIKRLPVKGLKQRDCWCFEEYINTPQNTPNPKDLRTAIYIPVDERSDLYTIQGPEVVTLLREPFVHLEGVGEFFETAPKLWGEFHGSHTAVLPMDHMTGMWAGNLVKANGLSLYRPGATFSCSKAEVEKAALLPGAQIGAVGDGKSYARFEITGPFSALGDAFGDCLDRVKAAGLKRREDAFNWETYLSDPAVTAPSENRIDIYVAVE